MIGFEESDNQLRMKTDLTLSLGGYLVRKHSLNRLQNKWTYELHGVVAFDSVKSRFFSIASRCKNGVSQWFKQRSVKKPQKVDDILALLESIQPQLLFYKQSPSNIECPTVSSESEPEQHNEETKSPAQKQDTVRRRKRSKKKKKKKVAAPESRVEEVKLERQYSSDLSYI